MAIAAMGVEESAVRAAERPEPLPPLLPHQAHLEDIDRIERGLARPVQNMSEEEGLRQRTTHGENLGVGRGERGSSSSTEGTLIPSPTNSQRPAQAYRILTKAQTAWQNVPWGGRSRIKPLSNLTEAAETAEEGPKEDPNARKYEKDERFIYETVDKYQRGFPNLSAFMNSNDTFSVFRAFKLLHTRILNELQVEITELEKKLFELDESDARNGNIERLMTTKHKNEWGTEKLKLMSDLKAKMKEYREILLEFNHVLSLGRTPERHYRSVLRWVLQKMPLGIGYFDFIWHAEDFVSVTGHTAQGSSSERLSYFDDRLEVFLANRSPGSLAKRLLKTNSGRKRTSDERVNHYSDTGFELIRNIFLVTVATWTILMPVFLLFWLSMSRVAMGMTVLAFVLMFSTMLVLVTRGKPLEVLIGTVAYGAILTAFLGNLVGGCDVSSAS